MSSLLNGSIPVIRDLLLTLRLNLGRSGGLFQGGRIFLGLLPHVSEWRVLVDLFEHNARAARQVDEHAVAAIVPAFRAREEFGVSVVTLVAVEFFPISVEDNLVLARQLHADLVVAVAVAVVEVEREHEVILLEHGDLVGLVRQADVLVLKGRGVSA